MDTEEMGVELLLSQPEIVAWLEADETADCDPDPWTAAWTDGPAPSSPAAAARGS